LFTVPDPPGQRCAATGFVAEEPILPDGLFAFLSSG
jgi:hypothetical protein